MSYPFVREFQVPFSPFVCFGALSTELDILPMGDRVRLLSSVLPPQICSNNGSSAPLSLTVFPAQIQVPAAFLQEEKTPAAQFVFFFVFLFLWFSMS